MRPFDYKTKPIELLTPELISMLTAIHEHKGKQELFVEANADELTALLEIAKIQSTCSSNRIEGVYTTDRRLKELVKEKSAPRNRSEEEIAGYRDVLATIHESYEYIYPRPNIILQLHKQLYSFSRDSRGGVYKVERLCAAFMEALERDDFDPLVLIPMFILDFLCIHPFNDGNGRMSRLLTLLLLYRAGYIVGKYISIERLIEDSKETYYEALQAGSMLWHEGENDYLPFLKYYLGILLKAYGEFEDRVDYLKYRKLSKTDRVKVAIDRKIGKITKQDILDACPDISKITVERTLAALVKDGYLVKIGAGRTVAYGKVD